MPLDQPQRRPDRRVNELRMSFGDHLEELRRRLLIALAGPLVASVGTLVFGRSIVAWLITPLTKVQERFGLPGEVYAFGVPTAFAIYLKVSLVSGLIIAFPWVCYQLWKFVEAGLYSHERKVAVVIAPFSALMSMLGVCFVYYVLLPICLIFMIFFTTSFPPPTSHGPGIGWITDWIIRGSGYSQPAVEDQAAVVPSDPPPPATAEGTIAILTEDPPHPAEGQMWFKLPEHELRVFSGGGVDRIPTLYSRSILQPLFGVNQYINFVALLALGIVIGFQLPVVMLILGWSSLVDPRFLLRYRKYCVFICFGLGAVFTPADPISMIALAVPLWALFEFGLLLMKLTYRGEGP